MITITISIITLKLTTNPKNNLAIPKTIISNINQAPVNQVSTIIILRCSQYSCPHMHQHNHRDQGLRQAMRGVLGVRGVPQGGDQHPRHRHPDKL